MKNCSPTSWFVPILTHRRFHKHSQRWAVTGMTNEQIARQKATIILLKTCCRSAEKTLEEESCVALKRVNDICTVAVDYRHNRIITKSAPYDFDVAYKLSQMTKKVDVQTKDINFRKKIPCRSPPSFKVVRQLIMPVVSMKMLQLGY